MRNANLHREEELLVISNTLTRDRCTQIHLNEPDTFDKDNFELRIEK